MVHSKTNRALAKGHRSQSEGDNMSIQGVMMIINWDSLNTYISKCPCWVTEREQKGTLHRGVSADKRRRTESGKRHRFATSRVRTDLGRNMGGH